MSLCISFKVDDEIFVLADSQLTTTINSIESATILPYSIKVLHKSPNAIKIQIASHLTSVYAEKHSMIFSIAGNVSLGLQSILHIDAILSGTNPNFYYEDILDVIYDKINLFWRSARDKVIEYTVCIYDENNKAHIFDIIGSNDTIEFSEVEMIDGILLSVIGDNKVKVRNNILTRYQSAIYLQENNRALYTTCIKELVKEIEDESNIFVGGCLQAAKLTSYNAKYLKIKRNGYYFRGAAVNECSPFDYETLDIDKVMLL